MGEIVTDTAGVRETSDASVAAEFLASHDDMVIVSHLRPDGDCLGSTIALLLALRKMGKRVAAFNTGPIGDKWAWLPGIEHVHTEMPSWTPKLIVSVDCGSLRRVADDFAPTIPILNIDHHLTNTRFGDLNYIDIETCAVGEQIYNILAELKVELDITIATGMYLSILTDTGSFRYSNATSRSLAIASELVGLGVDGANVALNVYESREKGEFLLTGRAYAAMRFEYDGVMVWSELLQKDYAECGGPDAEPEGLASDIRGVNGVEISVLFHEMPDGGGVRAGFRGKGNIDCSAIASVCGGGGHFNASGAMIAEADYEKGRDHVLAVVRKAVEEYCAKK